MLLAPPEVLAEQHYGKLREMLVGMNKCGPVIESKKRAKTVSPAKDNDSVSGVISSPPPLPIALADVALLTSSTKVGQVAFTPSLPQLLLCDLLLVGGY